MLALSCSLGHCFKHQTFKHQAQHSCSGEVLTGVFSAPYQTRASLGELPFLIPVWTEPCPLCGIQWLFYSAGFLVNEVVTQSAACGEVKQGPCVQAVSGFPLHRLNPTSHSCSLTLQSIYTWRQTFPGK